MVAMRNIKSKAFNFLFILNLVAYSNQIEAKNNISEEKTKYEKSERDLNGIYSDIKNYIKENKVELNYLIESQRDWLKRRNLQCGFKDKVNTFEGYMCLSSANNKKTLSLKSDYMAFDKIENNLIKPFSYVTGIQKKLDVGGCWCSESTLKIIKDKIYIYQACDKGLKDPIIYKIVGKISREYLVEYKIDTNNNGSPEFNLSFVTNGKDVWNIIPTVFRKEDLINLNFSMNYTTDKNLIEEKLKCSDF